MIILVAEEVGQILVGVCQEEAVGELLCSKSMLLFAFHQKITPVSMSAGRGGGNVLVTAKPSIPTGPRANRPLDPAIDPNREYGYKTKRGGKTISTSFTGGPPFRGPPPRGGGSMPKNARATMVGSTVRIGPAAASDRKSEPSKRSGHPGPHHAPQM